MVTHSSILAWDNPMDTGAWWAMVHGVTKSRTQEIKHPCTHPVWACLVFNEHYRLEL